MLKYRDLKVDTILSSGPIATMLVKRDESDPFVVHLTWLDLDSGKVQTLGYRHDPFVPQDIKVIPPDDM